MKRVLASSVLVALTLMTADASAFCGFYVGGAGAELFNDASQVVLMRDETRTILSMQNRYEGPVDDFAMVIPVPQVLMEGNVKTLEENVFAKLDQLTAPRLVEYFEQDPCSANNETDKSAGPLFDMGGFQDAGSSGVEVEAEFKVGEYEIVVLSATESTGLESWLTDEGYNLPGGAAAYYQPYIDQGMYFFVARVDSTMVTFDGDRAVLSPLRFDYDSTEFFLPIRLGMINSAGQQDIIIHTLGRGQRYEAANYDNVTIPTNLELDPSAKDSFPTFYKTLFARTLAQNAGAIVTEYSWNSSTCDPCPGPTLDSADLLTLGADVIGDGAEYDRDWVVTRLHARFAKDEVGEDIVFAAESPIAGGRESYNDSGELEERSMPSSVNNFQGRYIIRHPWEGAINCSEPVPELWGRPETSDAAQGPTSVGGDLAIDEDYDLAARLVDDIPELDIVATGARAPGTAPSSDAEKGSGCSTATGAGGLGLLLLALAAVGRRRRRAS